MESKKSADPLPKVLTSKDCEGQSSKKEFREITPRTTLFNMRNFDRAVDLRSDEKLPCKNTWDRDVKSTHVRNKRLLDLPFLKPKCCTDIYNISLDQQKLRKIQKYHLSRPVRAIVHDLDSYRESKPVPKLAGDKSDKLDKSEKLEKSDKEDIGDKLDDGNKANETLKPNTAYFPECYILPESDSDSDSDSENMFYEYCNSGSVSKCSMCSDKPDCGSKKKIHKVMKTNWRNLLHAEQAEICKDTVNEEINKHKMGMNFKLKLKKVF